MDAVHIKEVKDEEEWIVPLTVNKTIIPFKLDTGASVNLISVNEYDKLTVKSKIFRQEVSRYGNLPCKVHTSAVNKVSATQASPGGKK